MTRELVPMEKLPTSEARLKRPKQLFGTSFAAVVAAIAAATASIAATLGGICQGHAESHEDRSGSTAHLPSIRGMRTTELHQEPTSRPTLEPS